MFDWCPSHSDGENHRTLPVADKAGRRAEWGRNSPVLRSRRDGKVAVFFSVDALVGSEAVKTD
jgi:hypothetical protein